MSNETAVTVQKADAPVEWGTRDEVKALAGRLATMLPKAHEMTPQELQRAAQYCRLMDVNPFRGEVYFYKSRGQLVVVDGYKSLTRWAERSAPYSTWDENVPLENGRIEHVRVWILRDDRKEMLDMLTGLGAPWNEAIRVAATYADGVVTEAETVTKKGGEKDPPTGWTWRDVAKKRALKNALNLSHGAPSPREMAELSWDVNGVKTLPEDWNGAEELSQREAEALAELRAKGRLHQLEWQSMTPDQHQRQLQDNVNLMRGDHDPDDPFGIDAPSGPDWAEVPGQDSDPRPEDKVPEMTKSAPTRPKVANVRTKAWAASAQALVAEVPYYEKDGQIDWYHLTGAAAKLGYAEITDENLDEVLASLREYAVQKTDVPAEEPPEDEGAPSQEEPNELDELFPRDEAGAPVEPEQEALPI